METLKFDTVYMADEEPTEVRKRDRRATALERPNRLRPQTVTINTMRKESKQTLPAILSMDPVIAMRATIGKPITGQVFTHIESLVRYFHEDKANEVILMMLSIGDDNVTPIHAAYLEAILHGDDDIEDLEDLTAFVEEL